MRGCVVSGNEGVGIVVGDVAGVELGGPVLWPPRSGVVGVVDARFEPQLVLSDNGEGGLAGVWDTPGYLRLEGAEVSGNGLAGVAVHGRVEVSVRDTAVLSTWSEPGQGGYGFAAMGYDALGPEVWIDAGSILSANEDTGIGALEGAVGGAVDLRVDAEVSLNGWFGVGAQGPRVDLALGEGALIAGCAYAGVVVASGAELKLDGARIVGSYAGEYALVGAGDGLWIKEGASAIVSGAFFAANEGAGIRARDAAALSVTATLIEGGTYGVVIEGPVDAEVEVTCVGQSEACEVAAP